MPNIDQSNPVDICQYLIQCEAQDVQDEDGTSALGLAALFGNINICKILVDAGANVNLKNKYGMSPLHIASRKGHKDICHFLIEAGSNIHLVSQNLQTQIEDL
ncbi:uncharacterized protein [Antedon mediterranea]